MKISDLLSIREGFKAEMVVRKYIEDECLKFEKPAHKEQKAKLARSTATSFVWIARTRTPIDIKTLTESLYKDQCFLMHVRDETVRTEYDYESLWGKLKSVVFKIDPKQRSEDVDDIVANAITLFTVNAKTKKTFELYSSLANYLSSVCTNLYLESSRKRKGYGLEKKLPKVAETKEISDNQIQMIAEVNLAVAADFSDLESKCQNLLLKHYGWDEAKFRELLTNGSGSQYSLDVRSDTAPPKTIAQIAIEEGKDKEATLRQAKNRCLTKLSDTSIPRIIEILNKYDEGNQIRSMLEDRLKNLKTDG